VSERDAAEVALYPLERVRGDFERRQPGFLAAIAALYAVWLDPRGSHGDAHGAHCIENHVIEAIATERIWINSSTSESVDTPRQYFLGLWGDIFGNCFLGKPAIEPSVLAWRDGLVVKLAQAAYDNRLLPSGHFDRDRVAVLADALSDAGCQAAAILEHLRGEGLHVRGCWCVDLLLGKG
jgi:hypothetical protein